SANDRGHATIPEALQRFIVKQESLTLGTGAGNRVAVCASAKTIGREGIALNRVHAWSELDELLKIPAVQRQVPHLLLIRERTDRRTGRFDLRCLSLDGDDLLL